jgi:hypothetical protein
MPEQDPMDMLRAQVERTSMGVAADMLGVSRTAISLLLSGKYRADTKRMFARIHDVLGGHECPYTGAHMANSVCKRWHTRQRAPAQTAAAVLHWRACQRCEHNPAVTLEDEV